MVADSETSKQLLMVPGQTEKSWKRWGDFSLQWEGRPTFVPSRRSRLLFTFTMWWTDYLCSATAVTDGSGSPILTAGHYVYDNDAKEVSTFWNDTQVCSTVRLIQSSKTHISLCLCQIKTMEETTCPISIATTIVSAARLLPLPSLIMDGPLDPGAATFQRITPSSLWTMLWQLFRNWRGVGCTRPGGIRHGYFLHGS